MHHDGVQKPLQPPYSGPYKVIHQDDTTFTIEVNGQQNVVSLDYLQLAQVEDPFMTDTMHIDDSFWFNAPPVTSPTPTVRITRSGRHVHWPSRFGT